MITETCSVCGSSFDVVFRYQMEEKNGGFAFYCSQKCLEKSQTGGDAGSVSCDACMKRFTPELVSQVLYLGGKRRYACSLDCRSQIVRESQGARLGDLADAAKRLPKPAPLPSSPTTPANPSIQAASTITPTPAIATPSALSAAPAIASASAPIHEGPAPSIAAPPSISDAPPAPVAVPLSTPPGPLTQPPPSAGKASSRRESKGSVSSARTRREDGAAPERRASGLHSAIRPDTNGAKDTSRPDTGSFQSAIRSDASDVSAKAPTGTVIPLVPPLKGEKKAEPAQNTAPRRIAVFNHKGGTGKTTTAVSIAAGLAAKGKKVLLVDTDAQGNVSVSLGAGSERSLYHVLVMGLAVKDAVKEVRPNLHLLPSNETLAAAELYLAGRQNRDRVLADRLNAAAADYDYVVLDCSPSLSLMNQNALVFADSVLVPVACDYLSLVGVRQVLKTVKNVNSLLHHPVQIWGVLPTFFDGRAKICNEAVATLKDHFGDKCLPPIRAAIKVKEAPSVGQTIFEYAAGSNAAEDYGVIVDRITGLATPSKSEEPEKATAPAQRTAATA